MTTRKKLIRELKKRKYQTVAIIGHTSIDPDSIASAFGMAFIIRQLHPTADVDVLVNGIGSHVSKPEYYTEEFLTEFNKAYDLIIVVDVNVVSQFGSFQEFITSHPKDSLIIFDHHTPSDFSKDIQYSFIQPEKTSTAEMVMELITTLSLKPPAPLLTILLSGIIYDSRRFYSLNSELLKTVNCMLELGADYDLAVSLIQKQMDVSERIARLKCASRLTYYKVKNWLVAWSKVGAHEGSTARAILDVGADVALIFSKRKKLTRLTVRAKNNFYKKTELNFGSQIMQPLGEIFGGDGGGHSTAAALTIKDVIPEETLQKETMRLLNEYLANLKK